MRLFRLRNSLRKNGAPGLGVCFATALAGLALLSACGGGSGAPEKTLVRYGRWGLPSEIAAEKELISLFEAQNPDIEIKVEYASWAEYNRKIQAQMAARSAPDVFLLGGTQFHDYLALGQIEDLTERFANDPSIDLGAYYQAPIEVFTVDGRRYGMPRDCNTVALYFNKNLFDEAGIAHPTSEWTWPDLLEAAKALTRDHDGDGRTDQFGFLASFESMEVHWGSFVWQNGGRILSEDRTECLLDTAAAREALEFYTSLVTEHEVSPDASQAAAFGSQMFLTGRVAMTTDGSWMVNNYDEIDAFEWSVVPLPAGKREAAPVNGLCHVMSSTSPDKEAAWRFIRFMGSEAYQKKLAELRASIPALKSVAESPEYLADRPAVKEAFLAQFEYAQPLPFTPGFPRWEAAIRSQLELVWLGRKEATEACRDAAAEVEAILAEATAP
ncbi:MAG: sugar ABC transporter substrate-binding protein [Sumerlaeia bacterium]